MNHKGNLAIRRIYSLVDMIKVALMFIKLVYFGSKICIVGNKIRFKATHHLQYRENVHFLLPPPSFYSFIISMTNVTILGVFRTHAQKEYGKVWE